MPEEWKFLFGLKFICCTVLGFLFKYMSLDACNTLIGRLTISWPLWTSVSLNICKRSSGCSTPWLSFSNIETDEFKYLINFCSQKLFWIAVSPGGGVSSPLFCGVFCVVGFCCWLGK